MSERYQHPHSPRYEYDGITDHRMSDRREASISIRMIAEKASHAVSGNGIGYALMMRLYVGEASWWTFSESEQALLRRVIRRYAAEMRRAGFLPAEDGIDRGL